MAVQRYKPPAKKRARKVRLPSNSPSIVDGRLLPSDQLPPIIRELQNGSNKVLLAFSGKDSLCAWLFLRDHGFEVIPFWFYVVPGLSFDEEMLDYYERWFGTRIIRYPYGLLYQMLANYKYQPPQRIATIDALRMDIQQYDYEEVEEQLIQELGLPPQTYTALGMRAADNTTRAYMINRDGAIGLRHRFWYAVWDWKMDDIIERIKKEGIKLSRLYSVTGATGDMWHYTWYKVIRKHFPADYEKIRELFPLVDLEFFRYEQIR